MLKPERLGLLKLKGVIALKAKQLQLIHQGSHTGQEFIFELLSFFVPLQTLLALSKT